MAIISVRYCCGCGYKTSDPKEAVHHSDDKLHTIDVLGTIKPSSPIVAKPAADRSVGARLPTTDIARLKRLLEGK